MSLKKNRLAKLCKQIASVFLTFIFLGAAWQPAKAQTKTFNDLDSSHWAYRYIMDTVSQGLFTGISVETFSPDTPMSRAMFVTVLKKLDGHTYQNTPTPFTDVTENAWYYKAVSWAYGAKIVSGVQADAFSPHGDITREQMAVMLHRFLAYMDIELPATPQTTAFADADTISGYAIESVNICQNMGLITGMDNNHFAPHNTLTRAQAAVILSKLSVIVHDAKETEMPITEEILDPEEPEETEELEEEEIIITYTVTFHTNGGNTIEPVTITKGKTVPQPKAPLKSGYTFDRWYIDENLSKPFDFKTIIDSSITLYAKWRLNTPDEDSTTYYQVTYQPNGGTGNYTTNIASGSTYTVITDSEAGIARSGYLLTGWNTRADNTGDFYSPGDTLKIEEDITLYAQWVVSHIITYDANGGAGGKNLAIPTGSDHQVLTIDATGINYSGYRFNRWNTELDGSGNSHYPGSIISSVTNDMVLYAQWIKIWTITYDANDGSGRTYSVTADEGVDHVIYALSLTGLEREGYIFSGWAAAPDGSANRQPGDIMPVTGDVVLYAVWLAIP